MEKGGISNIISRKLAEKGIAQSNIKEQVESWQNRKLATNFDILTIINKVQQKSLNHQTQSEIFDLLKTEIQSIVDIKSSIKNLIKKAEKIIEKIEVNTYEEQFKTALMHIKSKINDLDVFDKKNIDEIILYKIKINLTHKMIKIINTLQQDISELYKQDNEGGGSYKAKLEDFNKIVLYGKTIISSDHNETLKISNEIKNIKNRNNISGI